MTGQKYGRWTVVERSKRKPLKGDYALWVCRCECGWIGDVARASLIKGKSKSCGCYQKERQRELDRTMKRRPNGMFVVQGRTTHTSEVG